MLNKSRRRYHDLSLMTHWLSPEQMANIYQTSAIVLNPHRPAQFAYNQNKANVQNMSLNNRAFDIAASGGFQLTDLQPSQAFSSFAFYTHENDLIKQVEHYVKTLNKDNRLQRTITSKSFAGTHLIRYLTDFMK